MVHLLNGQVLHKLTFVIKQVSEQLFMLSLE